MAAITTTILELTRPNTLYIFIRHRYTVGLITLLKKVLPKYNIKSMYFDSMKSLKSIIEKKNKEFPNLVSLVYIESPANPTNSIVDIEKSKQLADHFSTKKDKV